MRKRYLTLVAGRWREAQRDVQLPLTKFVTAAGERRVNVDQTAGCPHARCSGSCGPILASPCWRRSCRTGRTHQIRVHLQHLGFPIAGDDKYGDFALNRALAKQGLKRMFLHAFAVELAHPASGAPRAHRGAAARGAAGIPGRPRTARPTTGRRLH